MRKKDYNYSFAKVSEPRISRSLFKRSQTHKTTFDSGFLIPIYVDEVLPADTFDLKLSSFCRLTTPVVPVMDEIYMDFHFFFVPARLLWEHWKNFCGERDKPDATTDYLLPKMSSGEKGVEIGSIFDYMGIPPKVPNLEFSSLPFRAYNLIWNDWFRDQNLQEPVVVYLDDKDDALDRYTLLRRNKRHDYFTSALPWPQKGPGVSINLSGTAPIVGDMAFDRLGFTLSDHSGHFADYGLDAYADAKYDGHNTWATPIFSHQGQDDLDPGNGFAINPTIHGIRGLKADLTNASSFTTH